MNPSLLLLVVLYIIQECCLLDRIVDLQHWLLFAPMAPSPSAAPSIVLVFLSFLMPSLVPYPLTLMLKVSKLLPGP
uniref:Putative product n=1 Tax=Xenopsylla cheopis TaxID=163159 RepID=A0A6M2DV81_XENCH